MPFITNRLTSGERRQVWISSWCEFISCLCQPTERRSNPPIDPTVSCRPLYLRFGWCGHPTHYRCRAEAPHLATGVSLTPGYLGRFLLQEHLPLSSRQGLEPNALSVVTITRGCHRVKPVTDQLMRAGNLLTSHPTSWQPPGRLFRSGYLTLIGCSVDAFSVRPQLADRKP